MAAPIRLPEHAHCMTCGDPVTFGDEYCSEECKATFAKERTAEKKKDMRFYIILGASLAVLVGIAAVIRFVFM